MRHFSASLQAFAAGALFLTTGCAPSIYTSIQKSYPARIEGSTVLVYDMADSLPEPAEVLGSVTVKDSGFSVNCNYAKVMQRARTKRTKSAATGFICSGTRSRRRWAARATASRPICFFFPTRSTRLPISTT